jgi:imidazolonepropionase-like amidohydrolase
MHRLTILLILGLVSACSAPPPEQAPASDVTVFEGARVIVGDGQAPIENATIVVDGARIAQVGRAADISVPDGATRVSLAGKTVMPTIIDTHTHLSQTTDALTRDLRIRPYYGVSAAMSLGQDQAEAMAMRGPAQPGMARFFSAGLGIAGDETGRTTSAIQVTTPAAGRAAVQKVATSSRSGSMTATAR